MPDANHTSSFELSMAGVDKLVAGTIAPSKAGQRVTAAIRPKTPTWAAEMSIHTRIELTADGYDYTVSGHGSR
jgi:hypothetical protein